MYLIERALLVAKMLSLILSTKTEISLCCARMSEVFTQSYMIFTLYLILRNTNRLLVF